MKKWYRNSAEYDGFERETNCERAVDKMDYQHYQFFQNESSSKKYYANKKLGLTKLMNLVMEQELTDKQREVVILVMARGMKQNEVAKLVGVSPSTVNRHLKAAQKKFDYALKFYDCKPDFLND